MAGVWIFSPPRLLVEEPRGDEGQGLVVVPPDPVADLVVAQARFALAALEALFDVVFGFGHAGERDGGGVRGGVREVVVVFDRAVRLMFARDEQHLVGARAACWCAGLDAADGHVDHEWSLLAIAHVERGPRGRGDRRALAIDALPRHLGRATASRVLGRWNFGIAAWWLGSSLRAPSNC